MKEGARCVRQGGYLWRPGNSPAASAMPYLRPLLLLLAFYHVAMTTVRSQEEEVLSVTGLAGRASDLPCYLNPRTPNDRPKLILWYKRGTRTPVFSYVERMPPIESSIRQVGGELSMSRDAATLTLSSVGLEAEGVYECRVDFFKSPTHTSLVNLTIVEAPQSVEVRDSQTGPARGGQVGPYHEGQKVILTCVSRKGTPQPNVTWWQGNRLIDDTWETGGGENGGGGGRGEVENTLVVERLTRDYHNTTLTCAATNTRLVGPVTARVVVKMLLLPTSVVVSTGGAVREGGKAVLVCTSKGSRPAANLTWKLNGDKVPAKFQKDDTDYLGGDVSSSTLMLNVTRKHDGARVSCEAKNPTRPGAPLTNYTTLTVHYPPRVEANLGKSVKPEVLKEGDDVYFTCSVSANPPAEPITWYHKGKLQVQNVSEGVILVGDSLALQEVGRKQAGSYTCAAANHLSAVTSRPITLRIKYTPECQTSPTTYFIYDKPINITCTVSSYPPVKSIRWQWNNSNEVVESQPVLESDQEYASAQFTVHPVQNPEDRALSCWAVNEMGKQTQPCGFSVKVAKTPLPLSSCRLANITASSLSLTCQRPDASLASTSLYRAEVYFENRTMFANVTSHRPNFNVSRLDAGTSYQIKVYVTHGPVTSQPVVVSAYTSRTSRTTPGDKGGGDSGSSVGGALGGVAVTVAALVGAVAARNYCRKRRGRRKQDPRPPSDDSNPDVVPNIEETYDLLSSAEQKVDVTHYEVMDGPLSDEMPLVSTSGKGSESYYPLVLQQQSPREMIDDYPGVRSDLYCPVDQLMQAEESVV